MKSQPDCSVVDLPGIYSLRPYTNEEIVTRDFLLNEKPDGIINIVDATNMERNLYLTLQLMEMRSPMVLALNMMDEVRNNGGTINVEKMSEALGIPVVPISAAKNEGIEELVQAAVRVAKEKQLAKVVDFCKQGPVHRCIHSVCHQIDDHAEKAGLSVRFSCSKRSENDTRIVDMLQLSPVSYTHRDVYKRQLPYCPAKYARAVQKNSGSWGSYSMPFSNMHRTRESTGAVMSSTACACSSAVISCVCGGSSVSVLAVQAAVPSISMQDVYKRQI